MSNMDFSFLKDNLVYKLLTRESEHLNSFKNIEFIMQHDELEAYYDLPEISPKTLLAFFEEFEVIQDGEVIKELEDYKPYKESLALYPLPNGQKDVFLIRAS